MGIHTRAGLGWDGMGCAGNSVYFNGGVHTSCAALVNASRIFLPARYIVLATYSQPVTSIN